ncbi:MAG: amino acid adenylation domain-containing protein [Calothrix sp. MO_192.B10]|nr:amino acid adenylation domain-containing protein [Calothrix sp. MO_192.B10]
MNLNELLFELSERGIKLSAEGEKLHVRAAKEVLTRELRESLNEHKAVLLASLNQHNQFKLTSSISIPTISRDREIPLTSAQEGLWFLEQVGAKSSTYNISVARKIVGNLNLAVLEKCIAEIVRRHEVLRTSFRMVSGSAVQVIDGTVTVPLSVIDLQLLPKSEQSLKVQWLANQEARQSFDLETAPLMRFKLLKLGSESYVLLLTIHHIISDYWSMGIITQELATLYKAFVAGQPSPLPELPLQYADYAYWQHQWLTNEMLEGQYNYWQQQLAGAPNLLTLSTDRPRPSVQTFHGSLLYFQLDPKLTQQLKQLSQQTAGTLYMTLLTAFMILLSYYSRQKDILVGSPIANRNISDLNLLIGFFVNTLVMRGDLSGNPTIQEMLQRIRKVALDAFAHKDLPFGKLVEKLCPERNQSYNPLFQVCFVLQNVPLDELNLPGLSISSLNLDREAAIFDLTLSMEETGSGLQGYWEYNSDLFDVRTIEQMSRHFEIVLKQMVANPQQKIDDLVILNEEEVHQQLITWNSTQASYPEQKTIHQLFEEQASKTPNNIAVVYGNQHLTYWELETRANQLAHYLQQQGVGTDTLVALCLNRSLDMIVAILGVLKAGGAYLPMDPDYPQERLSFMVEDSQVSYAIATQASVKCLPPQIPSLICLDTDAQSIAAQPSNPPTSKTTPSNLAYCIYTSGSTGKPKGALLEHGNVVRLLVNDKLQFTFTDSDVWTMFHYYGFDFSVWEMYGALLYGGKLIVVPQELTRDPSGFLELLIREKVTVLNQTPTFFYSLMQEGLKQPPVDIALRYIIFGGEALYPIQLKPWKQVYPNVKLINMYGITETTVHVTFKEITEREIEENVCNVGIPIPTITTYIMDSQLRLLPVGVPGEICVGGDGVSRGYLNRDELTAKRFVQNPYNPQERIYRSGDLAKLLPNGEMIHLGRMDHQVKIRGFRVELGEIQNHLLKLTNVSEAVVVAKKLRSDDLEIVAYIVPTTPGITVTELRNHLGETLPYFMVPSAFVILEKMPITSNGKVDHKALPAPDMSNFSKDRNFVAPRDFLEMQLVQIWEEVLQVHPVGVQDNFFEIGGHSLLAVQLMAHIQEQFAQNLPLSTLFQGATIEELASILRHQGENQQWSPLVGIQTKGSKPPFFCVHPIGGNVLCYADLAHHLGHEQPFYGLQARGLTGKQKPRTSIEDMATDYLESIRSVQPQGPYYLGGWSFGGLVAFEMAQMLHSLGEEVALLTLIDTQAPIAQLKQSDIDDVMLAALVAKDLGGNFGKTIPICEEQLQQLEPETQLNYILESAKRVAIISPDANLEQIKQILQVYKANIQAFLSYAPQIYPNRITLVQATESSSQAYDFLLKKFPQFKQDEFLGWSQFSAQPIEVHSLVGNHYSILSEPQIHNLVDKLRLYLD